MVLDRLKLHNFRNYADLVLEVPPGVVLIVGANGQGKTNLLEAVEVASTTRSGRGARPEELVQWGRDEGAVYARFQRKQRATVELSVRISKRSRQSFAVNGTPARQLSQVMRQAAVISFSPMDVEIVRGAPAVRRRMLNVEISKLSARYCDDLARYRRVVRQRNEMLRHVAEGRGDTTALDAYTCELAKYAVALVSARMEFLGALEKSAASVYQRLAGASETLTLRYRPSFSVDTQEAPSAAAERLVEELAARRLQELRCGMTILGPHRDDFGIYIRGRSGRRFASQGQQRTAAIALRMAQFQLADERLGEAPVLLLDDVLSELDQRRAMGVLELADTADQVLLTATDAHVLDDPATRAMAVFQVEQGRVERTC